MASKKDTKTSKKKGVEWGVENNTPRGLKVRGSLPEISPEQKEILDLLKNEFLTVKQIAIRRETSTNAVYKIKKKLARKGLLNNFSRGVENLGGSKKFNPLIQPPKAERIRLHAEHFILKLIWFDERYYKKVKDGVLRFVVDGNTIQCHRRKVEVYSNNSFFGKNPDQADSKALKYWLKFFVRLESDLKIILVKNRSQNILRVRAEFSEVGNELAEDVIRKNQKIRIRGEDGKTWLLVDNSFNLSELETVHKLDSKDDMQQVIQPFFNDLRVNPVVLSHVVSVLKDISSLQKVTQGEVLDLATALKSVLELLKGVLSNSNNVTVDDTEIKGDSKEWYYG